MNFDNDRLQYQNDITKAQNQIEQNNIALANQQQAYEENYNNQVNSYDQLLNEQKNFVDEQTRVANENQQARTDYQIGLIDQQKEQAAKDTQKEVRGSYIDYMRETNRYGANRENLASNGMTNQGYTESLMASMYNTYQSRVATAKESLQKANQEYQNQINQALLENNATLAENALNALQQKMQLSLQGFEYKNTLYQKRLEYLQNLDNTYYNRNQALNDNITTYQNAITSINQSQRDYDMKQKQFKEQVRQYNESLKEQKRQFDKEYALSKKAYARASSSRGSSGRSGRSGSSGSGAYKITGNDPKKKIDKPKDTTVKQRSSPTKLSSQTAWQFWKSLPKNISKSELASKLTKAKNISIADKVMIASQYGVKYQADANDKKVNTPTTLKKATTKKAQSNKTKALKTTLKFGLNGSPGLSFLGSLIR